MAAIMVSDISKPARLLTPRALVRPLLALAVLSIDVLVSSGSTTAFNGVHLPVWFLLFAALITYLPLGYWRSGVPGYISMLVLSIATLLVPGTSNLIGFLLALFFVARHASKRQSYYALAGSIIPLTSAMIVTTGYTYHGEHPELAIIQALLWIVLFVSVWFTARALERSHRKLSTERRWASEARDEAMKLERLRISRDLHDSVAHSLTAMILQIAGVRTAAKNPQSTVDVDAVLAEVQSTAEQSMRELHRLLGMLRNETGEGEQRLQGIEEIADLIDSAHASGLDVTCQHEGERVEVDPSISHTAYRVVQEGLSNAMKHAGTGAKVSVGLLWQRTQLCVEVRSLSGVGASPAVSGGFGLIGLRERTTVSGGTLTAGATDQGFLLQATLPISGTPLTTKRS